MRAMAIMNAGSCLFRLLEGCVVDVNGCARGGFQAVQANAKSVVGFSSLGCTKHTGCSRVVLVFVHRNNLMITYTAVKRYVWAGTSSERGMFDLVHSWMVHFFGR